MAHAKLRIYCEPENSQTLDSKQTSNLDHDVKIRLGDVLPMLADALNTNRTWIRDFEDDEITIPSDLYDVLMAYEHFRRPSA